MLMCSELNRSGLEIDCSLNLPATDSETWDTSLWTPVSVKKRVDVTVSEQPYSRSSLTVCEESHPLWKNLTQ